MSTYRDSDDVAACRKLQSAGSGHGIDQVERVWDMITKRFPNSAPLLCELEAVIDRAEILLRELRAPKYLPRLSTRKSRDIHAADSGASDEESNETDAVTTEKVTMNIAETQISNSSSTESETDEDTHVQIRQFISHDDESLALDRGTKECSSMEDWDKIIDSTDGINAPNGQSVCPSNKSTLEIRQNGNNDLDNLGDSPSEVPLAKEDASESKTAWSTNDQGRGDVHTSSPTKSPTPQQLLKEYANRCGVSVDYYLPRDPHKSKRYAITCRIAEYTATALGETSEKAKDNSAMKILRMIVDCQMDDSVLVRPLLHFTRREMLEVLNFCEVTGQENAQRKLYKLCLDKLYDIPRYDVQRKNTSHGFVWAATCTALGHIASGEGVRKNVAKKAAAENLYQQYA